MKLQNPKDLEDTSGIGLLVRFFEELSVDGVSYAVPYEDLSGCTSRSSDVDILMDVNPINVVPEILKRLGSEYSARLVNVLHYEVPHGYYFIVQHGEGSQNFIHLDCLYDPLGINKYILDTKTLLADRERTYWGYRLGSRSRFLYLLIKRILKTDASETSIASLKQAAGRVDASAWVDAAGSIGEAATKASQKALSATGANGFKQQLKLARRSMTRFRRRRHLHRWALALAYDCVRKLRRAFQPTGYFVVIVGPDGSGKSTVARLLESELRGGFRRTRKFHWRPGLFPKLRRSQGSDTQSPVQPPSTTHYPTALSFLRFAYYLTDFILGYWVAIYATSAQTGLVIGERYFLDVLVNPSRYGFNLPKWILRAASALVPAPDLTILLEGDPAKIFARKPELDPSEIAFQIGAMRNEIRRWGHSASIDTEDGAEATTRNIAQIILANCAARTERRLSMIGAEPVT